jgi:lipid II:glycine glycyltransferase (peptidoglycan interpeptide bridge formation enzyme)
MARAAEQERYVVQTSGVDKEQWSTLLRQFDDATIYQTWSFGMMRHRGSDVRHVIIESDGEILSICQVCIKKFPLLGTGTAEVHWGPLWRKKRGQASGEALHYMVRALKEEFAGKQSLMLTIWPYEIDSTESRMRSSLQRHGFRLNNTAGAYQTLRLDLSQSMEGLRKNLSPEWRRNLNRAVRNNLQLREGDSEDLYKVFLGLQKEMLERKKYVPGVDYEKFLMIQNDLRADLKMRIMVCEFEREPVCAAVCSAIGETGIYLLGATGDKGLKLNGSNLLQWRIIEWLKERNCRWYDLGGVDPLGDPGVYHFKKGILGKGGKEERLIGGFYYCAHLRSYLLNAIRRTKKRLKKRKRGEVRSAPR